MRCTLRSAGIVMGTAPSPARFSRECFLLRRAHTERPRAPLDRPFHRRREPSRSVQCRVKLFLVLRQAVPSATPRLDLQQSQSFQRLSKNDASVLFSHDLSGPNMSCFREARLLQSANMTPKFEDGKVLSRKGCHVHGAEFPTEWCL